MTAEHVGSPLPRLPLPRSCSVIRQSALHSLPLEQGRTVLVEPVGRRLRIAARLQSHHHVVPVGGREHLPLSALRWGAITAGASPTALQGVLLRDLKRLADVRDLILRFESFVVSVASSLGNRIVSTASRRRLAYAEQSGD